MSDTELSTILAEDSIQPLLELATLKINGVTDLTGFDECKKAKRRLVTARTTIEEQRKQLKAPWIAGGDNVDAEAKRLTALLAPVEKHLTDQVKAVELAQAKAEAKKLDERFTERMARLNAIGGGGDGRIRTMADHDFNAWMLQVAESNRIRREREEAQAIEDQRLATERARQAEINRVQAAENEAERQRLKADRDALIAEQKRLADEQASRDRAEEAKRIAAATAAKAEAERVRQEALKPDKDQLATWAGNCRDLSIPEIKCQVTFKKLEVLVDQFADQILIISVRM